MNNSEKILSTLTDEQKKKIEAAKTPEELNTLAEECGNELTIDQLEGVSGGIINCTRDNYCVDFKDGFAQPIV